MTAPTPKPQRAGLVDVTQADREAAADAVKAYRDQKDGNWQARIRAGECDDGEMVQAFARHRADAIEKLTEALEATEKWLRLLQPALNVMAREIVDDIIKDNITTALSSLSDNGGEA